MYVAALCNEQKSYNYYTVESTTEVYDLFCWPILGCQAISHDLPVSDSIVILIPFSYLPLIQLAIDIPYVGIMQAAYLILFFTPIIPGGICNRN